MQYNGLRNGIALGYFPSGKLKVLIVFREDVLQGFSRIYNAEM